ncbi:MAG: helix-turn-helix domain-containing protein, partial [Hyphococcus sp.]
RADKGESWLRQVIDYIHAHAADNPSPADLAAIAGRHPTHMMRAFKKQTGTTIGSYIQAVKVDLACQLMRSSARSLTDIASTCGFADQSHFIRTFRAAMGVAPSVYRKALL